MKRKVATGILVLSILISSLAGCGAAHTDTAAVAGREAATDTEVSAAAQNSEAASEEAQVMDETAEEGNHANGTPWLNSRSRIFICLSIKTGYWIRNFPMVIIVGQIILRLQRTPWKKR